MIKRDPGMQPERTAIAWDRTALALVMNAVLMIRSGLRAHSYVLLISGIALVGLALAMGRAGLIRRRQLVAAQPNAPSVVLLAFATAATVFAGACGAWGLLLF